jgi:hypothetical protein
MVVSESARKSLATSKTNTCRATGFINATVKLGFPAVLNAKAQINVIFVGEVFLVVKIVTVYRVHDGHLGIPLREVGIHRRAGRLRDSEFLHKLTRFMNPSGAKHISSAYLRGTLVVVQNLVDVSFAIGFALT